MSHFSIWLWCTMKRRFYTTTSHDQLSGWTKKKLQSISHSQNSTKRGSWTLFAGLLPVWSTIAFWIPVKPLHLRSMLSTSMRCTKSCNTCSQYRSTERVLFLSTTMPDHMSFKSWTNWVTKFCLIHHIHLTSHQLTTTSCKHLSNFLQGKHFQDQKEAESAFQEFAESQCTDFYATK